MFAAVTRFEQLQSRSFVAQAADAIVAAAVCGDILPGDRLIEAELARMLGISRVPVREALRLLESQGLVESEPYKGMRLMTVTTQGCRDMLSLLQALVAAALDIIGTMPPAADRWWPLHDSLSGARAAMAAADRAGAFNADLEFFGKLFAATRNTLLITIARRMTIRFCVYAGLFAPSNILAEGQPLLENALGSIEAGMFDSARDDLCRFLAVLDTRNVEAALAAARERRRRCCER